MLFIYAVVRRGVASVPVLAALAVAACIGGCKKVDDLFCSGPGCEWTADEWAKVQSLSYASVAPNPDGGVPLGLPPPPSDPSNAYLGVDPSNGNLAAVDPESAIVKLGRDFYYDRRFSGEPNLKDQLGLAVPYARAPTEGLLVSCADCHDPRRGGADFTSMPNTVSIGAGWYDVNGQQTVNVAYYPLLYWNGRTDTLWAQAAQVSESAVSMNGTRANTYRVIAGDPDYSQRYSAIFQPSSPLDPAVGCADKDAIDITRVMVNWAKAIEAYEYTLLGGNSTFDQFVRDPAHSPISPAARRGARLFVGKASCIGCHNGPLLSDMSFHNIGVPQTGAHVPTVADCQPSYTTKCDCSQTAAVFEKANCLPSGAWTGLTKLHNLGGASAVTGNTDFRRDFVTADPTTSWSDQKASDHPPLYFDPNQRTYVSYFDYYQENYYIGPPDFSYQGKWRTPSLRDVAVTAPYMHDGYYQTLEDVVWHYNNGGVPSAVTDFMPPACGSTDASTAGTGTADAGAAPAAPTCVEPNAPTSHLDVRIKPLDLTADEISDLVEFLKTLTSTPPPDGTAPDAGTRTAPAACPTDGGTSQ